MLVSQRQRFVLIPFLTLFSFPHWFLNCSLISLHFTGAFRHTECHNYFSTQTARQAHPTTIQKLEMLRPDNWSCLVPLLLRPIASFCAEAFIFYCFLWPVQFTEFTPSARVCVIPPLSFCLFLSDTHTVLLTRVSASDLIQQQTRSSCFLFCHLITESVFCGCFLGGIGVSVNVCKCATIRASVVFVTPACGNQHITSVLIFVLLRGLFPVYRQMWQWSISHCLCEGYSVLVFSCVSMCGCFRRFADH